MTPKTKSQPPATPQPIEDEETARHERLPLDDNERRQAAERSADEGRQSIQGGSERDPRHPFER